MMMMFGAVGAAARLAMGEARRMAKSRRIGKLICMKVGCILPFEARKKASFLRLGVFAASR
jgi:hypothetical protein